MREALLLFPILENFTKMSIFNCIENIKKEKKSFFLFFYVQQYFKNTLKSTPIPSFFIFKII